MHDISSLQNKIESALGEISLHHTPADLYDPIRYMLSLGGKRMRPLLVLLGCDLFGGDVDKALHAACGIEVFHNFTLLHDDIMDKAPLRRSQPTVHTKWNPDVAILSGDAMFVKSFELMSQTDDMVLRSVLNLFCKTAIEVCEGQQMDMEFEKKESVSEKEYIEMISLKTSVLLACSLKTGALIAGANEDDANHIYQFGKNTGIAFQIQDDLLDAYGSKEKFGKQVGGDILANKKTLLYIKATMLADDPSKQLLKNIYSGKTILNDFEKIEKVKAIFDNIGVKNLLSEDIKNYYSEAMQHLNAIKQNPSSKNILLDFCQSLMVREY